ncbi:MAG TPA: hypothetical protein VLT45_05815 [Kofleriaceae bacterium]|nr:hypothetical protein [Kofleriaceae bacterium]
MRLPLLASLLFSTLIACTASDPLVAPDAGTPTKPQASHKTLLREDAIGSGATCPGGGVLVHTGRDTNDDGALEDSEIEDTVTVCYADDIFHGDLRTSDFATPDAQTKLTHVRVVTGNLVIDSDAAMPSLELIGGDLELRTETRVELPALAKVGGSLAGPPPLVLDGDTSVERGVQLVMPVLASVGGNISMTSWRDGGTFAAPALPGIDGAVLLGGSYSTLDLHALKHAGSSLDLATQASTLALPALQDAGDLRITGSFKTLDLSALGSAASVEVHSSSLATLALPSLRATTRLQLGDLPNLTKLELPALAELGTLALYRMPQLTTLDMPQLTAVDTLQLTTMALSDLHLFANLRTVKTLAIKKNAQLADLAGLEQLTQLTTLSIADNGKLASLDGLEALTRVDGDLTIQNNASLTSLSALAGVTGVGGAITITSNAALAQADVDAFLHRLGR